MSEDRFVQKVPTEGYHTVIKRFGKLAMTVKAMIDSPALRLTIMTFSPNLYAELKTSMEDALVLLREHGGICCRCGAFPAQCLKISNPTKGIRFITACCNFELEVGAAEIIKTIPSTLETGRA